MKRWMIRSRPVTHPLPISATDEYWSGWWHRGCALSTINNTATIDMKHLTRHVTAVIAGKVHERGPELAGLPWALERCIRPKGLDGVLVEGGGNQWGPDGTGCHTIDANTAFGKLDRRRAGKTDDSPLGGRIVDQQRVAFVGRHRGSVDNARTLLHVGQRGFREAEHGDNVGLEGAIPLLVTDVFQRRLGVLFASIVHHNIEPTKLLYGIADDALTLLVVGNIAGIEQCVNASLFDFLHGELGILVLLKIDQHHIGAFLGIVDCDCAANTTIGASDNRDFAFQLGCWLVGLREVNRTRGHVAFAAWALILVLWGKSLIIHNRLHSISEVLIYCDKRRRRRFHNLPAVS